MKNLDYIFDGAMGTYYSHLKEKQISSELENINDAQTIIQIHQEYIDAGVNAIKTNTFGINSSLVQDINHRNNLIIKAIDNARQAVETKPVSIFANIGLINVNDNINNEYLDIVKVFEKQGIRHFIFETLIEYDSIKESVNYIKTNIKDSVVIASWATNQDGYTQLGNYYKHLIEQASLDVDYVGLNCMCGPKHMYELLKKIDTNKYKISAMPNAGYPDQDYTTIHNEEYFSDILIKYVALGLKIIGACCGSTPNHLKQIVKKLNETNIEYDKPIIESDKQVVSHSNLKKIIFSQEKLIAAEVEPPTNTDISHFVNSGLLLKQAGAHVLTLVDSPLAKTRADSLMMATKLKNEVDIDVLPHLTCRDKNQIAIKGGLLAANIDGVNNVLALSGDAIAKVDRDYNSGVFCFNSHNLINYINELNQDVFVDNPFLIAGALNINAFNFDAELKRAQAKLDNKVDYFITQSLFTKQAINNLKKAYLELNAPIVVGLYPVASYRNALFLNNEVKGIDIPASYIKQLKEAEKEDYQAISVANTNKVIEQVYDYCAGFYISTPLKKTAYVIDIIKYIKSLEK